MSETAAVELYSKFPDPLAAIERIGEFFARSGMFGNFASTDPGKVLAMACLYEHKSPIEILRQYHVIEGRLSDRADAMLAKFKAKGGKYKVVARTGEQASVEMTYEGQTLTFSLSWEEAQKEPFVWMNTKAGQTPEHKKNWRTPRARMQTLWARAVSDGVRTLAPEIVAGIYTPEEIQDEEPTTARAEIRLEPGPAQTVPRERAEVVVSSEFVGPPQTPKTPPVEAPAPQPTSAFATTLPQDTLDALEKVIGHEAPAALAWLRKEKNVVGFEFMSKELAAKILARPDKFLRIIKEQPAQATS